jgi:hypothetical protein
VIGDQQPLLAIRKFSAPQLANLREQAMKERPNLRGAYREEYAEFEGTQAFLNARQNYPLLVGCQSNTFKCFLILGTVFARLAILVHDDGLFLYPKTRKLREYLYPRLRF